MDSLSAIQVYLAANVLLLILWGLLFAIRAFGNRVQSISFSAQLSMGYAGCALAVVLPFAALLTSVDYLPQAAQVWTASTMNEVAIHAVATHRVTVETFSSAPSLTLQAMQSIFAFALLTGALLAVGRIVRGLRDVHRVIAGSHELRRRRSLRILACDSIGVPFSFWLPRRHFIIVPSHLLASPRALHIALRHEAQHHAQGDTKMLYVLQLLVGLCFWNPAVYRLLALLRQTQEFACDEVVVRSRRISARSYCQCLLDVAEHAASRRMSSMCLSMADETTSSVLRRRIDIMMREPRESLKRSTLAIVAVGGLLLMSAASVALSATIKDRRISAADAQRMAQSARANSSFPIVVNDSVVQELNRYLGTPDGRAFVRDSLQRMQEHRDAIGAKLTQYGLPSELLAVPIVESGYRNLAQSRQAGRGAGIWMFIAPTARKYSLRVDDRQDERMNVSAETDAAMRMFSDLHQQFGDWGLALLAYNSGSSLVEQGIRDTRSRDVWNLVNSGYENDPDYIPRLMAAILIMQNPDTVK